MNATANLKCPVCSEPASEVVRDGKIEAKYFEAVFWRCDAGHEIISGYVRNSGYEQNLRRKRQAPDTAGLSYNAATDIVKVLSKALKSVQGPMADLSVRCEQGSYNDLNHKNLRELHYIVKAMQAVHDKILTVRKPWEEESK